MSRTCLHETSVAAGRSARAGALVAALRAFALTAALSFCAVAQADPVETERLMQEARSERAGFESNLQQAYADLDDGQTEAALPKLALARAHTTALSLRLGEVVAEIRKSREQGQYTDARALEIARVQGLEAKKKIDSIDGFLGQMSTLPHPFTRALIDAQRPLFDRRMEQLELELVRSQS